MAPLKFLIVDDSPVIRLILRRALIQNQVDSARIWEAESFHEAVDTFEEVSPDVVFLDVSLPEGHPKKSGPGSFLEYLTTLAANDSVGSAAVRHMRHRTPGLRIVLCTGNPPDDPRVRELLQEGALQILQKPVNLREVGEVVRRLEMPSP